MYSRHSRGFFARSVLRRMLPCRSSSPFRFHSLHKEARLHAHQGLPLRDDGRHRADLFAIPRINDFLPLHAGARANLEDMRLVLELDLAARPLALGDPEQVALAPDVVAFPFQVFARRFALLLPTLRLLLLDPASFEMAKTRIVSRLMRYGAEMRTRPVGGWTLRWTFLMSFSTTSTAMSPS